VLTLLDTQYAFDNTLISLYYQQNNRKTYANIHKIRASEFLSFDLTVQHERFSKSFKQQNTCALEHRIQYADMFGAYLKADANPVHFNAHR